MFADGARTGWTGAWRSSGRMRHESANHLERPLVERATDIGIVGLLVGARAWAERHVPRAAAWYADRNEAMT